MRRAREGKRRGEAEVSPSEKKKERHDARREEEAKEIPEGMGKSIESQEDLKKWNERNKGGGRGERGDGGRERRVHEGRGTFVCSSVPLRNSIFSLNWATVASSLRRCCSSSITSRSCVVREERWESSGGAMGERLVGLMSLDRRPLRGFQASKKGAPAGGREMGAGESGTAHTRASRQVKGAPGGAEGEVLVCLDERDPPHATRISRQAKGTPWGGGNRGS